MASRFKVGLVQMAMTPEPAKNLEEAVARVKEARRAGADVVCLPELFRSQYFCQREDAHLFDLAEPVPGPTTEALGRAAGIPTKRRPSAPRSATRGAPSSAATPSPTASTSRP